MMRVHPAKVRVHVDVCVHVRAGIKGELLATFIFYA